MSRTPAIGLLVLRLALGITMILHGNQKLIQMGISGVQKMFKGAGVPLPELARAVIPWLELIGGIAIILGLATRIVAALLAIDMAGAIIFVHAKAGFFASDGGYELVMLLGAIALALVLTGLGSWAIDRAMPRSRRRARA